MSWSRRLAVLVIIGLAVPSYVQADRDVEGGAFFVRSGLPVGSRVDIHCEIPESSLSVFVGIAFDYPDDSAGGNGMPAAHRADGAVYVRARVAGVGAEVVLIEGDLRQDELSSSEFAYSTTIGRADPVLRVAWASLGEEPECEALIDGEPVDWTDLHQEQIHHYAAPDFRGTAYFGSAGVDTQVLDAVDAELSGYVFGYLSALGRYYVVGPDGRTRGASVAENTSGRWTFAVDIGATPWMPIAWALELPT